MTTTVTKSTSKRNVKVAMDAGDPAVPVFIPRSYGDPVVVVAAPGGGGSSVLAEASWSLETEVTAGSATWIALGASATAKTKYEVNKPTAIRFTCTVAPGAGEISM